MKFAYPIITFLIILGMGACNYETIDKYAEQTLNLPEITYKYVFDSDVPSFVKGTPQIAVSNEKATLGRVLFYDKSLSFNNSTACASCHIQSKGFADGTTASEGFININTPRNSMAIANMFANETFFWDGRIDNLREMVMMPIKNHIEMGISEEDMIVTKVKNRSYYADLFKKAFGSENINIDLISEALTAFVGSIGSYNSKYDKVLRGESAFTSLENAGKVLFETTFDCDGCHALDINFGNKETGFANIGLDLVDSDPGFNGKFKIPNLRNIALTAPYMHDGRYKTLEEVADHYSNNIQPNSKLDDKFKQPQYYGTGPASVRGLRMTIEQRKQLIAFLNTLTDVDMITDPKFEDPFLPN